MLIDFELLPIEEIEPSRGVGPEGERRPRLSWFYLTDGHAWLNVGGDQLFRVSEVYREATGQEGTGTTASGIFITYWVARLWEDLLGMVPVVLEPVPPALARRLASEAAWQRWEQDVRHWQRSWRGDEEDLLLEQAVHWWHERSLPTSHLRYGPRIWLWRDEGRIRIRWDNRGLVHEGFPVWTAIVGRDALAVDRFIQELRSFHVRLIQAMADRVWAARADWSRSDVAIDLDGLEQEHTWRVQWGDAMLDAAAEQATDWDAVLGAVAALEVRHPKPAR